MNRYMNLLTPVEVGDILLKNRMTASPATPHFIQGTEPYPTEKWITMLANRARSGAAAVCVNHLENATTQISLDINNHGDHFSNMDWTSTSTHNYLCQMIDAIRYYGAATMYHLNENMLRTKDGPPGGSGGPGKGPGPGDGPSKGNVHKGPPKEPPKPNYDDPKVRQAIIDDALKTAVFFKTLGFQMLSSRIPQSSNMHLLFCLEFADALKQTLGNGYPIEFYTVGIESGISVQHNLELARALEGKIDILTVRYGILDWQHPTGFTSTRTNPSPCVDLSSVLTGDAHMRGAKLKIGVCSGIHDPDFAESLIADEKSDMIIMARTWLSEPAYVQKLAEDRGDDITPCVRCNKCHFPNTSERFRSYCTVNPTLGIEDKIDRMVRPVTSQKRVAVVGGGPGGMYAAITAAKRGHCVTLFEKEAVLGGQLSHADYASFKWPLADYKNWLIHQVYKNGVTVELNSTASRETLQKFDEAIIAVGARFERPGIPGDDGENVVMATDVYGKAQGLPEKIVVIGGSETGVETGMYLAENGHSVTVLCRKERLADDASIPHYRAMVEEYWNKLDTFSGITGVQSYIRIEPDGVVYLDANGKQSKVAADCVVLATGAKPNTSDAAALYGGARNTVYIGDCQQIGNVHYAVLTGFSAATQI